MLVTGRRNSIIGAAATPWSLERWIAYVFDRPVTAPEWYWEEGDLADVPAPGVELDLLTRLCERPDELLAPLANAQLNQGFWYLLGSGASGLTLATHDVTIPAARWERCIRAFVPSSPGCSRRAAHPTWAISTNPVPIRSTARATCGGISCRSPHSRRGAPARPSTTPASTR